MRTRIGVIGALLALGLAAADLPQWESAVLATPRRTSRMFVSAVSVNQANQPVFVGQFMNYKNTTGRATEQVELEGGQHYVRFVDRESRPDSEWVVANLATGEVKIVELPGFHSTTSCRTANGRVFFNMDFGQIVYYEPADNNLHMLGQLAEWVPYSTDRLFWKMALGPDGWIYSTTQAYNRKTSLLRLNPDTLEYRVYPAIGTGERSETLSYGYWFGIDPPWVYIALGQGQWELWAVNVEDGETRLLGRRYGRGALVSFNGNANGVVAKLSDEADGGLDLGTAGALWSGNVLNTKTSRTAFYWCYDGALFPFDHQTGTPPFPPRSERPPAPFAWEQTQPIENPAWPEVDTRAIVVDDNGAGEIPWRPDGDTGPWRRVGFRIQRAEPVPIEGLLALNDGSVFGSCQQYRGCFRWLPGNERLELLHALGSRPAMAEIGSVLYTSSYPNCVLHAADMTQPWTSAYKLDGSTNPRLIDYLSKAANSHHAVKLLPGPNGRLYLLGLRERRATGSGVAWYDPASGAMDGLKNALEDRNPAGMAILTDPPCVVVSGRLRGDEDDGRTADLVVYDLELKELSRHIVHDGWRSTGQIFPGATAGSVVGFVGSEEATQAYAYDVAKGKLLAEQRYEPAVDAVFARGAELWAIQGSQLCRVGQDLALTPVAELGTTGLSHPVWAGDTLYAARGPELVRFRQAK